MRRTEREDGSIEIQVFAQVQYHRVCVADGALNTLPNGGRINSHAWLLIRL